MNKEEIYRQRLERQRAPSVAGSKQHLPESASPANSNSIVDCGWGRLLFSHTFDSNEHLAAELLRESRGKRDIAFYVNEPHVLLALHPQQLFLDPSHTYRLWLNRYHAPRLRPRGFHVRLMNSRDDAEALHDLYQKHQMIPPPVSFVWQQRTSRSLQYFVACDKQSGQLLGAVTAIDHVEAFKDPEKGASFWALVVDPQAAYPGIGQALVRHMAEFFIARGRLYMDLSVLHDNPQAIRLYEHLGFERVPTFAIKNKNPFNEPLFVGERPEAALNPYASIIVREAQRRGIAVTVVDADAGYFELAFGGRSILCRESLSDLTSAVAMSRCDDKAVTHRVLAAANLRVPAQHRVTDAARAEEFLQRHGAVVVKPARGEQGAGISVDVRTTEALQTAITGARQYSDNVLLEEYCRGEDLRIIVIGGEVVAAATRRPPRIIGTGRDTVRKLIEKQSRRRQAATGGESRIPIDAETERCIREDGYALDEVLPYGAVATVRKTANLHTGGTIHDVTDVLHPALRQAAIDAAAALDIPVTGLDFIVPDVAGADYVIIEANERPGLANHEPQPTAQRFIDLLFPQTARPAA